MKVQVTTVFRDKFNFSRTYSVGEIVDFAEDRASDIIERGLGVALSEKKPRTKKKTEE